MLTNQEIFDKAVGGVIAQGRASSSEDGQTCFYRGPEGLKCGVGQLISDEAYEEHGEEMEGNNVGNEAVKHALYDSGIDVGYYQSGLGHNVHEMLQDIQQAHDAAAKGVDFLVDFKKRAHAVALTHRYKLQWNFN